MNQNDFLNAIATWAGTISGIQHAQIYESETNWQSGGGSGYGGLEFDVPALFLHAFDVRISDLNGAFDYDNEITLVLFTEGETRRSDARTLQDTILTGLRGQLYGQSAELVGRPRIDGTLTDQTPEWAEGEGLCISTLTYHQVFRTTAMPGVAFSERY